MGRSTSLRFGPPSASTAAVAVAVSAALSGAFAACSRGSPDTSLSLVLAPDASCVGAPVACVNELHVTFREESGAPLAVWNLPFDVADGSASLGAVPRSGSGIFAASGRAALAAADPVTVFEGLSSTVSMHAGRDQRVVVPVSCPFVPDPCADASPTPAPAARFVTGTAANLVVGKSDFTSCDGSGAQTGNLAPQNGGLREPEGLDLTATRLWVADRNFGRIASFDREAILVSPVQTPLVVGHASPSGTGEGGNANQLDRPRDVEVTLDGLLVADWNNHRAPWFMPVPDATDNRSSTFVLGQDNNGDNNRNDNGPSAASLNEPWSVQAFGTGWFVSDSRNHRLLHFAGAIAMNKPDADAVFGQANFTSIAPNRGGAVARNSLNLPAQIATDGTRLYLADSGNHRVLVWRSAAAAATGADPDLVLGQADFTSGAPNRGGAAAADTLNAPRGVAATPARLAVADSGNHRVLIWQPPPDQSGQPATEVLGQPDFVSNAANDAPSAGGGCPGTDTCNALARRPRAETFYRPGAALLDGDDLWVSDTCNHRIVRFTASAHAD